MPSFNQFLNYLLRLCLMCCINIFCMLSGQTCQVKLWTDTAPLRQEFRSEAEMKLQEASEPVLTGRSGWFFAGLIPKNPEWVGWWDGHKLSLKRKDGDIMEIGQWNCKMSGSSLGKCPTIRWNGDHVIMIDYVMCRNGKWNATKTLIFQVDTTSIFARHCRAIFASLRISIWFPFRMDKAFSLQCTLIRDLPLPRWSCLHIDKGFPIAMLFTESYPNVWIISKCSVELYTCNPTRQWFRTLQLPL